MAMPDNGASSHSNLPPYSRKAINGCEELLMLDDCEDLAVRREAFLDDEKTLEAFITVFENIVRKDFRHEAENRRLKRVLEFVINGTFINGEKAKEEERKTKKIRENENTELKKKTSEISGFREFLISFATMGLYIGVPISVVCFLVQAVSATSEPTPTYFNPSPLSNVSFVDERRQVEVGNIYEKKASMFINRHPKFVKTMKKIIDCKLNGTLVVERFIVNPTYVYDTFGNANIIRLVNIADIFENNNNITLFENKTNGTFVLEKAMLNPNKISDIGFGFEDDYNLISTIQKFVEIEHTRACSVLQNIVNRLAIEKQTIFNRFDMFAHSQFAMANRGINQRTQPQFPATSGAIQPLNSSNRSRTPNIPSSRSSSHRAVSVPAKFDGDPPANWRAALGAELEAPSRAQPIDDKAATIPRSQAEISSNEGSLKRSTSDNNLDLAYREGTSGSLVRVDRSGSDVLYSKSEVGSVLKKQLEIIDDKLVQELEIIEGEHELAQEKTATKLAIQTTIKHLNELLERAKTTQELQAISTEINSFFGIERDLFLIDDKKNFKDDEINLTALQNRLFKQDYDIRPYWQPLMPVLKKIEEMKLENCTETEKCAIQFERKDEVRMLKTQLTSLLTAIPRTPLYLHNLVKKSFNEELLVEFGIHTNKQWQSLLANSLTNNITVAQQTVIKNFCKSDLVAKIDYSSMSINNSMYIANRNIERLCERTGFSSIRILEAIKSDYKLAKEIGANLLWDSQRRFKIPANFITSAENSEHTMVYLGFLTKQSIETLLFSDSETGLIERNEQLSITKIFKVGVTCDSDGLKGRFRSWQQDKSKSCEIKLQDYCKEKNLFTRKEVGYIALIVERMILIRFDAYRQLGPSILGPGQTECFDVIESPWETMKEYAIELIKTFQDPEALNKLMDACKNQSVSYKDFNFEFGTVDKKTGKITYDFEGLLNQLNSIEVIQQLMPLIESVLTNLPSKMESTPALTKFDSETVKKYEPNRTTEKYSSADFSSLD